MAEKKPLLYIHARKEDDPLKGLSKEVCDKFEQHFEIITAKQLQKDATKVSKVDGAIVFPSRLDVFESFFPNMTSLKVITSISTGMDKIPVDRYRQRGIKIGYCPAYKQQNKTVADYAMLLLLAIARNFPQDIEYKKVGLEGEPSKLFNFNRLEHDVTNKVLGIVGMGRIGTQIARRAKAFDMEVLCHNRNPITESSLAEYVPDLESFLPRCDFIMICCPVNKHSEGMFKKKQLQAMKNTAMLVNISRGKIVDTDDLVEALQSGTIAAAALDVTFPEPLPRGHPLFSLPNVILTPHCSSHTVEAKEEVWSMVLDNLKAPLIDNKPVANEYLPDS